MAFVEDSPENNPDKWLLMLDGYIVYNWAYNPDYWKGFKGIITWNSKLYDMYKDQFNIILSPIKVPLFHRHYNVEQFVNYEDKINGVMLACRDRGISGAEGDIVPFRFSTMKQINRDGRLIAHCFGPKKYGNAMYQGIIGTHGTPETFPSSIQKLDTIKKYKFTLTFENCYHELWSWDWITEKILDAMQSKTIPIYYGAYNIDKLVPKGLYIDYREFSNTTQLVDYLLSISKNQYVDMTEKAYEWQKESRLGNIDDLKIFLKTLK
jgi:hypothetical protein